MSMSSEADRHDRAPRCDGDEAASGGLLLLWLLAASELLAFGLLLGAFLIVSLVQIDGFSAGRSHLNGLLAGINTMVLLTSGYFAARAAQENTSIAQTRRALILAALFGLGFAAIKLYEYSGEIALASDEAYGAFFQLYFLITGFHLAHVVFGAVILILVAVRPQRSNVVLITTLWHVIDLIWLIMFPLIYVI